MRSLWPFLIIALILAVILSQFASPDPDGLEKVAKRLGFSEAESPQGIIKSPMPNYTLPILGESRFSSAVAGLTGVLICFLLPYGFYLWRRK